MPVVFRVDASVEIGLGHVMRCLTLATSLRRWSVECHFVSRASGSDVEKLYQNHGFPCTILPVPSPGIVRRNPVGYEGWLAVDWEVDAEDTLNVIRDINPEWVVVDHYALDKRWHEHVKVTGARLMIIDDLANRNLNSDFVLDQSFGRKRSEYSDFIPEGCITLLGSGYMLLRPEFSRMRRLAVHRRAAFHGVGKILVSMGGTDPKNFTGLVLDGLSGIQWGSSVPKVEVVLSRAAPFLSDVRQRAHLHELDVEVSLDVTDMAQRMLESDLAIGASGSTSWERCCLGLPSIVLTTADNQRFVAKSLLNAGVALGSTNGGISVAEVGRLLARLCESPPLWKEMSHKAFMVTDGMGASRVVQEMYPMKAKDGQAVYLRPVTFDDVELLYQWQSNPQTRRYSNNKSVPQFHEHVAWLRDRLKSVSSLTQMIMHGDEPSGVIRLDPTTDENHDEFIISIYVSPSKYKLGLGRASLKMLCEMMDGCLLLAQVHEENDASHALFVSSGFEKISATYYSKQF